MRALLDEYATGGFAGHAVLRLVRGRHDFEPAAWASIAAIVARRSVQILRGGREDVTDG